MCETMNLKIVCDRIDPDDEGMLHRSIMEIPMTVKEVFGGFLMIGPAESASCVQEFVSKAVELVPKIGTATRIYLASGWILQRIEFDPDFIAEPVSWTSAPDIASAFQEVIAQREADTAAT